MKTKKKIAVLSLNPSIDRLIVCESISLGELNRVDSASVNFGGKGINVSCMLGRLGADVSCFCPVSKGESEELGDFLRENRVKPEFVEVDYSIRQNLKIIESDIKNTPTQEISAQSGDKNAKIGEIYPISAERQTEINERGGTLSKEALIEIEERIFGGGFDIICLCGSFPQGVQNSVYNSFVRRAREAEIITVLDCDGAALKLGFEACPTLIKPNQSEIKALLSGEDISDFDEEKFADACSKLCFETGGESGIFLTLGEGGSMFFGEGEAYRIYTERAEARGFAGAGDTALAAFVFDRYSEGKTLAEALKFANAAARAKIELVGTTLPTSEEIERNLARVRVEKLK